MSHLSSGCLLKQPFDYSNLTGLPRSVEPTWTICAVINGFAIPPIIVLNVLVIWSVLKDESLRRVTYNILLVTLAGSDLLTGLIVVPLYCWKVLCLLVNCRQPCMYSISEIPEIVCGFLSLSSLKFTTFERYLAIHHGQYHLEKVTRKRAISATILNWTATLVFIFPILALVKNSQLLQKIPVVIVGFLNVVVIAYCTTKVYKTAHRQRRRIKAQSKTVQREDREPVKEMLRDYKRAVNTCIIVLCSFLFYCPFIGVAVIQLTLGKDVTDDFIYIAYFIGLTFVHLQSLVNPIIMALRLSHIRKEAKKLLVCNN